MGVAQAKDYAGKLATRFAYSANGQGVYGIDMHAGTEGERPSFPTPDELWNQTFAEQNEWRDRFAAVPFEDRGGYFQGRYYQDIAVERVLEAVAANNDRILLTLAIRPTFSISSSSTSVIAAGRTTKATGAVSSNILRPPCS